MAEFNADINLDVKANRALAKINRVDKALNKLGKAAEVSVKVNGLQAAEKAAARLYAQLEKIESAALSKLPRQVQILIGYLKAANQTVGELAGRLAVAATLTGDIAGVNLAPLIKQLKNASALLLEIEKVQVRFINNLNFSNKLTGFNPKGLLDGLDKVRVRVLNTQKALDGLNKVRVRTVFTEKLLDGLDLVKVRIIEIGRLLRGTFGGAGGTGGQLLLPGAGGTGGGAAGIGGGGGGGGGALAIPGQPFKGFSTNTIRDLQEASRFFKNLVETAEIGSKEFRAFGAALDKVNKELKEATRSVSQDRLDRRFEVSRRNKRVERLRQKKRKGQDALSSGLIGGAFPLLFGQGVGASVGGAAGGAAGGFAGGNLGFGLSLTATALGTAFDELIAGAQETAKALARPSENFQQLNESLRLFDRTTADAIQSAIKLGYVEEANAKIRDKVAERIGVSGVQSLDALNEATKQAEIGFAELSTQLQSLVAGPLTAFLNLVNETLKESADYYKNIADINNLQERLTPEKRKEFNKEVNKNFNENRSLFGIRTGNQEELAAIIKKFTELPSTKPAETLDPAKLSPQDKAVNNIKKLNGQLDRLNKKKSVFDITDTYLKAEKDRARAQANYDKQRADIVRSYEESLANLRESVEQRVLALRIQGIQKANQLEDQRAANDLARLQAANRNLLNEQASRDASTGTTAALRADNQIIQQGFNKLAESELNAEQQKAKLKRDTAFEVLKQELAAERFKANIDKQVSKLNLETARRIEDINLNIARANEVTASNRFDLELAIAKLRLDVLKQEQEATRGQLVNLGAFEAAQQVQTVIDAIRDERLKLEQAKPPQQLNPLASVGGGGVPTAGIDSATQKAIEQERELLAAKLETLDITKEAERKAAFATADSIKIDSQNKINDLLAAQTGQLNAQVRLIELQNEGLTLEQARAVQVVEALVAGQLARLDNLKEAYETLKADTENVAALADIERKLIDIARARAGIVSDGATATENAKNLNKGLTEVEQLATDIAGTLGNGITDALVLAVSGTENLGEAFQALAADILQAIGKALILAAVTKAIGSIGSGGNPGSGLLDLLFREKGGPVTGNQPYIVGEKGPELFIPGVTGTVTNNDQFEAARNALSGGSSSSNDAFADNAEAIGTTTSYTKERVLERERIASLNSNPIDVRAETTVINTVEYVTAEQFAKGMKSTARDAQARVFSDLRNRPATRAQVGIR